MKELNSKNSRYIFIALEVPDRARHAGRIKKRKGLDFGQGYQVFDGEPSLLA